MPQSNAIAPATESTLQDVRTSVQLIDDAIYTDGSGTVTKGIAILGQDGTNPQAIKTDSSGELQVDVLTMPAVVVSGTVDTELTTADLDTGAGTDTRAVVGIAGTAAGGAQLIPGSSTDGLLVNLGTNNDVTVTGSVTANAGTNLNTSALAVESGGNLAGAATSLAILDDWDESDRAKINPIVGQAGVQGNTGTVSATTQRVVLATDVALPAGTNTIGYIKFSYGLSDSTYTVTGNGTTQDTSTFSVTNFSLYVVGTGAAATAWDVRLEVSLDGTIWTSLLQHTTVTGDGAIQGSANSYPVLYFRTRIAGLTLGGASNIRVISLARQ